LDPLAALALAGMVAMGSELAALALAGMVALGAELAALALTGMVAGKRGGDRREWGGEDGS